MESGATFCENCGANVESAAAPGKTAPAPVSPPLVRKPKPVRRTGTIKKCLIALALFTAILIVGDFLSFDSITSFIEEIIDSVISFFEEVTDFFKRLF
jgi:hypothetical protein